MANVTGIIRIPEGVKLTPDGRLCKFQCGYRVPVELGRANDLLPKLNTRLDRELAVLSDYWICVIGFPDRDTAVAHAKELLGDSPILDAVLKDAGEAYIYADGRHGSGIEVDFNPSVSLGTVASIAEAFQEVFPQGEISLTPNMDSDGCMTMDLGTSSRMLCDAFYLTMREHGLWEQEGVEGVYTYDTDCNGNDMMMIWDGVNVGFVRVESP